MQELRPGLWTWTAPHPDWKPEAGGPGGWARAVRSYAYDAGTALVLFDPMSPPRLVDELAAGRSVTVLLTGVWHGRSAGALIAGLGAAVHAPGGHEAAFPFTTYRPGDVLPGGVEALATHYPEEGALWIPAHRALVTGDVLLDGAGGLRVERAWLPDGVPFEEVAEKLHHLLELPVELVLPTHGDPVDDDPPRALRQALTP